MQTIQQIDKLVCVLFNILRNIKINCFQMKESRKPILILDANAFISCSKIHELGSKYRLLTTSDVIAELRDEKTKDYLQKIPFEVQAKDFDPKSLEFVKDFAKKTGDIGTLSDIDMELIALTHTLYVKEGLSSHIRKQPPPITQKVVEEQIEQQDNEEQQQENGEDQNEENSDTQHPADDQQGWITVPKTKKKQQQQSDSDMDDEQGWITPKNYATKMAQINTAYLQTTKPQSDNTNILNQSIQNQQQKDAKNQQNKQAQIQLQVKDQGKEHLGQTNQQFEIALISADFAIQNVATQMGIKLMSLDGRVITSIRRFIWECYLCWKQYKINENKVKLCSNCGYNSLSKISYSIDTNGNVLLHRKKGWKPNLKVQQWKQKKYQQQQKKKKHQHERRTKKQSIFDTV